MLALVWELKYDRNMRQRHQFQTVSQALWTKEGIDKALQLTNFK